MCLVSLFFFFRMRLFDEIKDYDIDLVINPTRPLARGLLSVALVRKTIIFLIALEVLLAFSFGLVPGLIYTGAVFYSLLMFKEFFIGDYLRPHLTTYAVTHTIVVALLGYAVMSLSLAQTAHKIPAAAPWFLLSHWFIFNLFEFARKTFGPDEERSDVPSYSKIFTLRGAYLLSLSQVLLSVGALSLVLPQNSILSLAGLAFLYTLFIIFHLLKVAAFTAKTFRLLSTAYMGLHFILLFTTLWSY